MAWLPTAALKKSTTPIFGTFMMVLFLWYFFRGTFLINLVQ
jgi:hypothetical protein